MGKNGYKEQIRSFYDKSNQISDEEQWKKLGIDLYREVPKFPGNKIYAKINIEPESARKLIKHFILVVNDSDRCEFKSDYREISVSGFDVKDKDKITVKIKAIPFNKNWKIIESKPCTFIFSGKNIGHFDTTTSFYWINDPKVIVLLKWNHIGDRIAQKYIVCLDNKEIQYINQLSIEDELSFYIHNLKPGENHTIEIIAKLNNGKETCRSDQIQFTIPKTKDEQNTEVLAVINEPAPPSLLATKDTNEDKKGEEPPPKDDRFKDRILELLRILEQQIANRRVS